MLNPINIKYFKMIVNEVGTETPMDIAAKCIVCGDSHKNPNKKRLHLYTKTGYDGDVVSCFNCGYSSSVYKFIENYNPSLLSSYKSEMGWGKVQKLKEPLKIRAVKREKEVYSFEKPKNIIPIQKSKKALQYLIKRKIKPSEQWYVSLGVLEEINSDINLEDFLIIPLLDEDGEWYGFYSRSLNIKYFYTYLPDINQGYKIWNFYNINKKCPVYIFESIMDALSTSLSTSEIISCLGADINDDRLQELEEPIFVFDNDKTGKEKSIKYAEKGYKVVVWPKEIKQKDCNEMRATMSKETITEIIKDNTLEGFNAKMKLLLN